MPKGFPIRECRNCGVEVESRWHLSNSGLCPDCGPLIQREATLQLIAHSGPWFDHWRARCIAAFGAREYKLAAADLAVLASVPPAESQHRKG